MSKQLTSTKFAYISKSIKQMLEPLKSDQKFIRMLKYLSDYPLDLQAWDDSGNNIDQPDFILPYDLIGKGDISLLLFNPVIVTEAKIYMFFSHLHFSSNDKTANITHTFCIDIVYPYQTVQLGDQLRNEIICDEICKCIDNQSMIADIGRCYVTRGDDYVCSDVFQGSRLFITADNRRF